MPAEPQEDPGIGSDTPMNTHPGLFATARGSGPVSTPSSLLPVFLHMFDCQRLRHTHTHTPLHTQTLFKALFFCFFVLLFFLLVFSYSIFIFMHATPGGCSFTWVYWNISALPQHEAKHYEWLPVCLAIVPLTSLRRLQASVTLGSFLYTRTYTHIAVNTTLKAIAARTRTHTQSPL